MKVRSLDELPRNEAELRVRQHSGLGDSPLLPVARLSTESLGSGLSCLRPVCAATAGACPILRSCVPRSWLKVPELGVHILVDHAAGRRLSVGRSTKM